MSKVPHGKTGKAKSAAGTNAALLPLEAYIASRNTVIDHAQRRADAEAAINRLYEEQATLIDADRAAPTQIAAASAVAAEAADLVTNPSRRSSHRPGGRRSATRAARGAGQRPGRAGGGAMPSRPGHVALGRTGSPAHSDCRRHRVMGGPPRESGDGSSSIQTNGSAMTWTSIVIGARRQFFGSGHELSRAAVSRLPRPP